jgi:sec-independent protein translocase protein TatC
MSTTTGGRMALLDHLREFRKRVVRSAIAISIAAIIGWVYYTPIITTLAQPVCDLKSAQASGADNCGALYINGVLGPLNLHIKVAILTGLLLAAPIWLYQLWAFIAPALHKREKKNSILVKFDDYLDFVTRTIFFFGLGFQLPVFLVALNLIGALSGKGILRPWRIWIFAITLFVAGFTPSPDPLSMIALALPLIALYFLAGLISLLNDRRREKKALRADSGD